MARFLRIDYMVSGSSPHSARLSKESLPLSVILGVGITVWLHREEGPGHCSMNKKLLSVQISPFDMWGES